MTSENHTYTTTKPNFEQKKRILKTPHPRVCSFHEESSDNKFEMTTKDHSFISRITNEDYLTTEKVIKNKSNQLNFNNSSFNSYISNSNFINFPKFSFISDYFINFEEIKQKNSQNIKILSSAAPKHYTEGVINDESLLMSPRVIDKCNSQNSCNSTVTPNFKTDEALHEDEPLHPLLSKELKNNEIYKQYIICHFRGYKPNTDTHKFLIDRKRKCKI
jgi:hypothetical protein